LQRFSSSWQSYLLGVDRDVGVRSSHVARAQPQSSCRFVMTSL
jgi:hypothetical protein